MAFKMDHIVLNVVDVDAMLHFYVEVIGVHGERVDDFRDGTVPFPSVRLNQDTIIDLFPKTMWGKDNPDQVCRPNLNHFCLVTDKRNWEELQQRLERNGIPADDGPVKRWGAHGTGISIYFRDPEENVIEVRYYEGSGEGKPCLLGS
ncbi:MAG: extradiol dioxygenase [Desulfuromonas sp.]|nr:MAG: extradiol dioxygenase [Desulfuromonas sp.]